MMRSLLLGVVLVFTVACTHTPVRNAAAVQNAPRARKQTASPPTAVALAMDRQVRNAIDAGEGDPFVRYLRQKISDDPSNFAARYALAEQYQKQGAVELALEHLRIAADRQPDSETAARKLSQLLKGNDREVEALAVLVRFAEAHPQASAELLEELAVSEDEAGALGEGERFHRLAIAAKPSDDTLRNNLGFNFLQQKKYGDAVHEFKAALQLNPGSEAARNNLATALALGGDSKEALLHWSSISGPAAAHNNLAAVLLEQGKLPEARSEIQTALDYDRHNPAAMQNLQLLSELDGKPASFTMVSGKNSRAASPTWAGRMSAAVAKFFRGGSGAQGRSPQENVHIASRKQNAKSK